jgi:ADP-heptose:LPS heptosyltransferase
MVSNGKPRVLFIRFGAIGNALVAVPAIRALRRAWPEAYFALAGDPLTLELLGPCPYIEEFIRYDFKGPEAFPIGYTKFIIGLQRRRFTHVIHFNRYLRSELIGFFSGARTRVGFETESRLQFLTQKVGYDEGKNVIEQGLKLVRALGVEADDRRLEYWPGEDSTRVGEILGKAGGSGPLVVIHPAGATQQERLWDGFGKLAQSLRERIGERGVMIGAEAERDRVQATAGSVEPPAVSAIGLTLSEVAELISRADLFAGADSGPAHIADAVGTPGAILYAPHRGLDKQLRKWKPEGECYLAFTPSRDCNDCGEYPCSKEKQKDCANDIAVDEVANALERLYAENKSPG